MSAANRIVVSLLLIPAALGQNVERVFRLTHTVTSTGQNEIATSLRTVADIRKLTVDPVTATITVESSATQVALAEWMVPRLDAGTPGPQSYNVTGNANDIVTVYPLAHVENNIGLQEVITTFRTVLDIQKIYNISASHTLVMRGTAEATAASVSLAQHLDHPVLPRKTASIDHFHIAGDRFGFDTLAVYGLARTNSQPGRQDLMTMLRMVLDLSKIYGVSATSDFAMRASETDIQVAEWLIARLDRKDPDPANTELKMPGGKDDVIHVFYLAGPMTRGNILELQQQFRGVAHAKKVYSTAAPPTIVVRGTADAIAAAGKLLANATQGL